MTDMSYWLGYKSWEDYLRDLERLRERIFERATY